MVDTVTGQTWILRGETLGPAIGADNADDGWGVLREVIEGTSWRSVPFITDMGEHLTAPTPTTYVYDENGDLVEVIE